MIELDLGDFRSGAKLTAISRLNASAGTNHTLGTRFGGRLTTLFGHSIRLMKSRPLQAGTAYPDILVPGEQFSLFSRVNLLRKLVENVLTFGSRSIPVLIAPNKLS
jgi:hypothetical protein